MKPKMPLSISLVRALKRACVLVLCLTLVLWGEPASFASVLTPQDAASDAKIPNDQLDSLVAPIALYPDPLLSQVLVASTYPLEIVQLSQWLQKNSKMPKEKMQEEVKKQDWDPSVQAMVVFPDLVKNMTENIKWTSDLGNAFLAQQSDLMDAVQRMRLKAKESGNLKSTEQQKVETKVVETKTVVVIEPASPQVVYVPSYNPTVIWGAPPYPYPVYSYPPPGYYAAGMAISFGVGLAIGAAWGGGGWGWGCGWGNNNVNINVNNNYINHYNKQNINNRVGQNGNNWQHNPQHRGAAPYSDRSTAQKYGGTARGDSMSQRQQSARQTQARQQGGNMGGRQQAGVSDRSNMGGRGASPSTMNRGGGDRIGNQSVQSGSRGGSAFGGSGNSRSSSMASSSRGASSMGSRGGGGGGSRGGGGGRRR